MGGAIFAKPQGTSPALSCPRMPPAVYTATRDRCATILRRFFAQIATPSEAPGKPDHGDVDFLVLDAPDAQPFDPATFRALLPALASALGAVRVEVRSDRSASVAVPWPSEAAHPADGAGAPHAQIDVALCSSAAELAWMRWLHAYGDKTQCLAMGLRPLGLRFTPAGLMLLDPAVEALDVDAAAAGAGLSRHSERQIGLSCTPGAVMRFLGLDERAFEAGFASEDALFRWICEGRLISRPAYLRHEAGAAEAGGASAREDGDGQDESPPPRNGKRRASEKRVRQTRAMFVRFTDEFLVQNPHLGAASLPSRSKVFDEALDFFAKRVEREERLQSVRVARREAEFWAAVKERIPRTGSSLNETVRALRRWVAFEEMNGVRHPNIVEQPELDLDKSPIWTAQGGPSDAELLAWVDAHWDECKARESERVKREKEARRSAACE